jgi:hypothetical protein
MSKIICDVCGTSYAETATQCPICGCARPDSGNAKGSQAVTGDNNEQSGYTYVKGGRFSKKNVRKRLKDHNIQAVPVMPPARDDHQDDEDDYEAPVENERSTKGLVVAVLSLLAAIIAVVVYLAVRFFMPDLGNLFVVPETTAPVTTVATTAAPTEETIPCDSLKLDDTDVMLTFVGDSWKIVATMEPADTTDVLQFFSSDESVATVTSSGEIRSVGEGTAVITVVCGEQTAECYVTCTVETLPPETTEPEVTTEPTTAPTTEPTTAPTEPEQTVAGPCKISHSDVTIKVGESFNLKLKDAYGNVVDVTWTSSKPGKVTINGNKITGAASGRTDLSCTVNGETYTCIVRVK